MPYFSDTTGTPAELWRLKEARLWLNAVIEKGLLMESLAPDEQAMVYAQLARQAEFLADLREAMK